ncbi:epoxyqueuosine reductase [Pullulanibacillus pueri]|uniref:Epoxyqueuosine reductase n=1 Tax=Pullulanibacillus pueri TaxID=1437324 RepID=A0A8J2ZXI3_9BACL|nr:tRNA epoxyqueuosine(34) reductase QueG [Pullulanibacillus pueri]MBM7683583.1 epoxyqueuosine reductase [Pullulanibacillus pueri]GGH84506.1 epoxyqueuosine reductase [Pullulanibacillus pueri]
MDMHALKEEIIKYSQAIGIDKIGFTTAAPFTDLKARLYQQRTLGYQSGFEEKDIELRTEPTQIMPEAQSIIAIALAYPTKMPHRPENTKGKRRGNFARASWGQDYHDVLRERMKKLEAYILNRVPDAIVQSMVDTGALSDRAVAERAGVGRVGKHTNLITKEFGSYVYLGELLTSLRFPSDTPIEDLCGECNLCVDKCPSGALVQGGQLNAQKCIAFLTQKKDFIPEPYRKAIGNRVYGCDTCQQVCPYNRGVDFHHHLEMEPDPEKVKPELKMLLGLSNREFKERFGSMSGSWRGKKPIQRNAIIALGNYKDATAVTLLIDCLLRDPRPVIRGTAAWSLGKIAKADSEVLQKVLDVFQQAMISETDDQVLKEIEHSKKELIN